MKTSLVVVLLNYYLGGLYKVDYDRRKPGSQNYYLIDNTGKKRPSPNKKNIFMCTKVLCHCVETARNASASL